MKHLNQYILEKFKITKDIDTEDKFEKEINKLISEYLFNEFKYELNKDYRIILSDNHNDLLIDFNEDLMLSYRKLMDIGQDIKKIFKKNWISCWSEPMLKSSKPNKGNHQINLAL